MPREPIDAASKPGSESFLLSESAILHSAGMDASCRIWESTSAYERDASTRSFNVPPEGRRTRISIVGDDLRVMARWRALVGRPRGLANTPTRRPWAQAGEGAGRLWSAHPGLCRSEAPFSTAQPTGARRLLCVPNGTLAEDLRGQVRSLRARPE